LASFLRDGRGPVNNCDGIRIIIVQIRSHPSSKRPIRKRRAFLIPCRNTAIDFILMFLNVGPAHTGPLFR
jgi:hypothetical protein